MRAIFPLQVFATCAMFGVIWFVQLVHYPLFQLVGSDRFAAYSAAHANRTTVVVAPLMLIELVTAAGLAVARFRPQQVRTGEAWAGLALVVVIWLSTALLQVPLHDRLRAHYTLEAAQRLVTTNWIRTAAWSARTALVFVWLLRLFPAG